MIGIRNFGVSGDHSCHVTHFAMIVTVFVFSKYYFLWVKPASIEDNPNDDSVVTDLPKVQRIYFFNKMLRPQL